NAATYYFSDCATGGVGSPDDPYCLDPGGDGNRESVMYLFDGAGTEAAKGDTIILCCGGKGGGKDAGSACTYHVNCQGTVDYYGGTLLLSPNVDATGQPLTIEGFAGDTVTITGDLKDDGVFSGTKNACAGNDDDIVTMITPNASGHHNVGGYIIKNLNFK